MAGDIKVAIGMATPICWTGACEAASDRHPAPGHHEIRERVEYEDADGRLRKLKPIRLGQLDVVVEVLKT